MLKNIHILITVASSLIGAVYFTYISSVDFPPNLVRIVPFVWLIGAVIGLMLGFRSLRKRESRYVGIFIIILALINIVFASIFSLAALMGD